MKTVTQTKLASLSFTLRAYLQRTEMCPAQAHLLRAALYRIAAGTYGNCVRCGGQIGMVRLTALPHASFCIPCQEDASYHRDSGNFDSRRLVGEGGINV